MPAVGETPKELADAIQDIALRAIKELLGAELRHIRELLETQIQNSAAERRIQHESLKSELVKVNLRLDAINGSVRAHDLDIQAQRRETEAAMKRIEKLPCSVDPGFTERVARAIEGHGKNWDRVWSAIQTIMLAVIVAKVQGWIP